ncbi:hypothetical protein, partial [Mycobacterium marinum]|uniref:hypothetical protein n=1 Tax=Mycobacterium marinum TaxID=1781 RepID=UPI003564326C
DSDITDGELYTTAEDLRLEFHDDSEKDYLTITNHNPAIDEVHDGKEIDLDLTYDTGSTLESFHDDTKLVEEIPSELEDFDLFYHDNPLTVEENLLNSDTGSQTELEDLRELGLLFDDDQSGDSLGGNGNPPPPEQLPDFSN